VAAALQDHRRARVVGEPTFRKGTVEGIRPLRDGTALLLTTEAMYRPSGDATSNGIVPDSAVEARTPPTFNEEDAAIARKLELLRE
jgi:carboxyl-terminal processing protease